MLKQLLIGTLVVGGLVLVNPPVQAQTRVPIILAQAETMPQGAISDEELQTFADVLKQLQTIEQETEQEMVAAVQNQQMSIERFTVIAQAQQNPEAQPEEEITPEELETFQQISSQLDQIQQQSQSRMEATLENQGLEFPRFREILATVRENPELREKVQQMLQN